MPSVLFIGLCDGEWADSDLKDCWTELKKAWRRNWRVTEIAIIPDIQCALKRGTSGCSTGTIPGVGGGGGGWGGGNYSIV